jgi:hypothetical protein
MFAASHVPIDFQMSGVGRAGRTGSRSRGVFQNDAYRPIYGRIEGGVVVEGAGVMDGRCWGSCWCMRVWRETSIS